MTAKLLAGPWPGSREYLREARNRNKRPRPEDVAAYSPRPRGTGDPARYVENLRAREKSVAHFAWNFPKDSKSVKGRNECRRAIIRMMTPEERQTYIRLLKRRRAKLRELRDIRRQNEINNAILREKFAG